MGQSETAVRAAWFAVLFCISMHCQLLVLSVQCLLVQHP